MEANLPVEPLHAGWLLIVVAALLLAHELGHRIAKLRRRRLEAEEESHAAVILGAVLGLMAFFLGFAFNIAESEFEKRRDIVLAEANAIGTAFLRARYLPAPHGERAQALLEEYVGQRMRVQDLGDLERVFQAAEGLHRRLWEVAVAVEEAEPLSEGTGLFVASLNEVIDLHTTRKVTSLNYRLPLAMVWALYLVSLLSLFLTGHAGARIGRRRWVAPAVLAVAVGLLLGLIQELDRPSPRLVAVSQQALLDTQATLRSYRAGP